MAEALVQGRKLLADPGIRAEPDVATVGLVCKVLQVSPKLGSAIGRRRNMEKLTGNLERDVNNNQSSPQQWPTMTPVGHGNDRQRRRTVLTDDDNVCQQRRTTSTNDDDVLER